MTQTTEAACLLQSGSMYPRRIGLRTGQGGVIFAGVKPGGVSIYLGDAPIYHFDLDGRWQRAFIEGVHYLKGVDTTVRSIDREREDSSLVLRRKTLSDAQTVGLDDSIRSLALSLIAELDAARLEVISPPSKARPFASEEFRGFLERVVAWDAAAWFAHRQRYLGTYGPLPFLPPDCPHALVLQATLGHPGGRAFGRARAAEHRVRSQAEFLEHARTVASLTGRRLAQHRGVFLCGADVLHRPLDEVLGWLGAIGEVLPIEEKSACDADRWDALAVDLGTVHAFLDDFASGLPYLEGWRKLRAAHLGRITLGVESGDAAIRARRGKTWREDDLRTVVAQLKEAKIGVGLVVLVGAGGRRAARTGLDATASLIDSLALTRGDLVTLVDARSLDESPELDPEPLSDEETLAQISELKQRSVATRGSQGPKLVAYNPGKQGL